MDENKLVLIPIWVLKHKVEMDHLEYKFLVGAGQVDLDEDEEPEDFPIYDSTITVLETLEKEGIKFNKKTGDWE